jgi:serine/threonine-protein kinase RsbW
MLSDRITLTVPARSEFAKTVRMTAAELASRLGMSYDEIDDVRLAAEEAFVYVCDCAGTASSITFTFTLDDGALGIDVGPVDTVETSARDLPSGSYAEFILQSICDEFSIEHEQGRCTLRLVRRTGSRPREARA